MNAELFLQQKLSQLGDEANPIREDLADYQKMLACGLISLDIFNYECLNLLEEADNLSNFGAR